MRKRPTSLIIYSVCLLLIALSFPVQVAIQNEIPIWDWAELFKHLTWLNGLTFVALISSSFLGMRAARHLMYMAPLTIILVMLNNYWVGYVGLNYSFLQTSIASTFFLALNLVLLESDARAVIRNQNIHWWRAADRRRVNLPVSVHPWVGESLMAITHDISISGAFITCRNPQKYTVGDRMQLRLSIEGYKDIRCTARLVRKSEGAGSYPAGFGVQFEDLSKYQKQFIENLVTAPLT